MFKYVSLVIMLAVLAGCASSKGAKYNYHVQPTPIAKHVSKYELDELKVHLELGHGAIEGDTRFTDEAALTENFEKALTLALQNKGILANKDSKSAKLNISINYRRIFNIGGNALNKPHVSHTVEVFSLDGVLLASFGLSNYTTVLGIGSNLKIAAFQWGAEDELIDINKIADLIAKDIYELGQ